MIMCPKCGSIDLSAGMCRKCGWGNDSYSSNCKLNTLYPGYVQYSMQYGWVCPKCGAVMAPAMVYCVFCQPKKDETDKNTIPKDGGNSLWKQTEEASNED